MTAPRPARGTADELRDAFDRSFALPPHDAAESQESLLAIRVAARPYSLRIGDIAGLASDRKVIPIPGAVRELVGIAGVRGGLVPVYSLAALLGYEPGLNAGRWLALCGHAEPLAFAFDELEGQIRVARGDVIAADANAGLSAHVSHVTRTQDVVRAIVNIGSVVDSIRRRLGRAGLSKER